MSEKDKNSWEDFRFLVICGVLCNLVLGTLANQFHFPVFLDCVGTLLAATLGGYIPAILVGFLTNMLFGLANPLLFYFAITNILIGCLFAFIVEYHGFQRWRHVVMPCLALALLCTVLNTFIGWMLHDLQIGDIKNTGLALVLQKTMHLPSFLCLACSSLCHDLLDKSLSVLGVFLACRHLPQDFKDKMAAPMRWKEGQGTVLFKLRSLKGVCLLFICLSSVVVGGLSLHLSYRLFTQVRMAECKKMAEGLVNAVLRCLPPNGFDGYYGKSSEGEAHELALKKSLDAIRMSFPNVKNLSVFTDDESGSHRLSFSADALLGEDAKASEELYFLTVKLAKPGQLHSTIVVMDHEWIMKNWWALQDGEGRLYGHLQIDVSMGPLLNNCLQYGIKLFSIMVSGFIVFCAISLLIVERCLLIPITSMTGAFKASQNLEDAAAELRKLNIRAGNELDDLYKAITSKLPR